jgi:hypothetical protein
MSALPPNQTSEWLGLRSRSKTGSLALFAAPHRGWQLRRTRLQSLLPVNKPTLIKDINGAGALHPMSAAPAVSMSVQGRPRFPLRVLGNRIRESQ